MMNNWVPCFLVIAQDEQAYEALLPHAPGRLVLAPPELQVQDMPEYAKRDSRDFRKVGPLPAACMCSKYILTCTYREVMGSWESQLTFPLESRLPNGVGPSLACFLVLPAAPGVSIKSCLPIGSCQPFFQVITAASLWVI